MPGVQCNYAKITVLEAVKVSPTPAAEILKSAAITYLLF
jgi:hypothetical protein